MATVAELLVKITADISGIKSGLEQGAKSFNDFGNKAESSFNNAGKSALGFGDILKANVISEAVVGGFRALGGAISGAVGGLKDFASEGIATASNLTEVQNVVDTTFGAGASQINDFAKTASTSFGLTELAAKQYTGTLGALLKSSGVSGDAVGAMATNLTGLAGDFASFYNLKPEEAFEKIRAGISGETEPLKQLGINMSVANLQAYALSQGITESYSAMSQAEQATLRYNYILSASADAQGDFAKTSGSFANQQRILQMNMTNLASSIGSQLLPGITDLTSSLNQLLSGQIDAQGFADQITGAISGLAETISTMLPGLVSTGVEIINALIDGLSKNANTIVGAAVEVVTTLASALIGLLPRLLELGIQILVSLVQGIAAALPTLIPQIISVILQLIKVWYDNLPLLLQAGIDLLSGLVQGIIQAVPILVAMLPEIIDSMLKFFTDALPMMIDAGITLLVALIGALPQIIEAIVGQLPKIIDGIIGALIDAIPLLIDAGVKLFIAIVENLPKIIATIVKALPQIITSIVNGIAGLAWKIVQAGSDLISGLWQGIKDMGNWLRDKISGFFGGVVDSIKNFFGIGSPSKLFATFGGSLAQGLGVGFQDQMRNTLRGITAFGPRLAAAAAAIIPTPTMTLATAGAYGVTAATPAASASEGMGGITNNFNLNGLVVREEADVQKISAQLYRLQQDRLRQRGFNG